MKKLLSRLNLNKHLLLSFIILAITTIIVKVTISSKPASSIGIIGGADGPTVVFLAGDPGCFMIFILFICLLILLLALYKPLKKIIKKS